MMISPVQQPDPLAVTQEGCKKRLTDYDFVSAQQAEHRARLFIQQVQIEIIVGQAMGEIFDLGNLQGQTIKIQTKLIGSGLDLNPSEQPKITLHRRKGKICAQRKCDDKKDERT
jgi:hypothetical protein